MNIYLIAQIFDDGRKLLWPEGAQEAWNAFEAQLGAEVVTAPDWPVRTKEEAEDAFDELTRIDKYLEYGKDSENVLTPVVLLEVQDPTFNTGGAGAVFPDNTEEIDRFEPGIIFDGEAFDADAVKEWGDLYAVVDRNREWYVFESSESAGEIAAERWRDMAHNDPKEFACLIGEERLVQWALGQSDSFGISGLDDFCRVTATVPEEEWASYDGTEIDVDGASQDVIDMLGFTPGVAYRHN